MTHQPSPENQPIERWEIESLRFTAFPSQNLEVSESDWWSKLVGNAPESRLTRPVMRIVTEEGKYDGGKLTLTIAPPRIDWIWSAFSELESREKPILSIGNLPGPLSKFVELAKRWLVSENCPRMKRIAFGAVILLPVETRQLGYRLISSYLPDVRLDAEGSSDFSYQINRPRPSKTSVAGLRINRLSKWSVGAWRLLSLSPAQKDLEGVPSWEHHACRLELDINTAAEYVGELDKQEAVKILEELVDLGIEILRRGDIA